MNKFEYRADDLMYFDTVARLDIETGIQQNNAGFGRQLRPNMSVVYDDELQQVIADQDIVKRNAEAAERILVAKGEAMEPCIEAFQTVTGIEVPTFKGEKLDVKSQGRLFTKQKGKDIPAFIGKGYGDVGIAGTDCCIEYDERSMGLGKNRISYGMIGKAMCSYSILALPEMFDQLNEMFETGTPLYDQARSRRRLELPKRAYAIPASSPRLLVASGPNRLIWPLDMPISGSAEITAKLSGAMAVADLVKTGRTAKDNNLREVVKLCDIYPAFVTNEAVSKGAANAVWVDESVAEPKIALTPNDYWAIFSNSC
jgi:hypothetical protein